MCHPCFCTKGSASAEHCLMFPIQNIPYRQCPILGQGTKPTPKLSVWT